VSPDAYQAYLRGLYFRRRRQAGGCLQAEPYLRRALELDPRLADAHAVLAFCYGFDHLSGRLAAEEAATLGRTEAERALSLDRRSVPAHVALALIRHRSDYDWTIAEQGLREALAIDPGSAEAQVFLGELLFASGRPDEGLAFMRAALERDPFHIGYNVSLGFALYGLARLDDAAKQFQRVLELDAGWATARFWLAETLAAQGRRDEAVAEYLAFLGQALQPGRAALVQSRLLDTYRRDGWTAFWRAEMAVAEDATSPDQAWLLRSFGTAYMMARRRARLGDDDGALADLGRAYEQREHLMVFVHLDPVFSRLHPDGRFLDLARRVGVTVAPPSPSPHP
jgi:tetratricopeptide (TPR) repeat protein